MNKCKLIWAVLLLLILYGCVIIIKDKGLLDLDSNGIMINNNDTCSIISGGE